VWAVAFAAVVSFMGLGLVDPILPAIAHSLRASPSDVELLFTSYFAFTGISMLVSGVVASRIGTKRTLLGGLSLVIVFSALAGASNSIGAIVGLRAGWGLGNALFIATALSVIVGAASGGVARAVILYEAALGLGISMGPLVGGELGGISWRGPFFGVAVLMAIGFVAISVLLERTPAPPAEERVSLIEPLRALRHRATRGSGLTALFYNFGFFTLLAYTPYPLREVLHSFGTHVDVALQILHRASELAAGAIIVGAESRPLSTGVTAHIVERAPTHVIVLQPSAGPLGRPHDGVPPGDAKALWRATELNAA
jgi:MFS family permease